MNQPKQKIKAGSEPYHITRAEAGATFRAARAHKIRGDTSYWRRPRGKAGK